MITTEPSMTNLFLQLGLEESPEAIASFISSHQLDTGVEVADAPFWSDAQRQFLAESLQADAAWTTVVDELNEALHQDAVQATAAI